MKLSKKLVNQYNNPDSLLVKIAGRFNLVKSILVEFEFAMFGGVRITAIMPLIFSLLRLMGKRVVIELHQVLHDLSLLSGHIGQKKGSLKNRFFSAGLNAFYFALGLIADELIVLEPALKEQLEKITGRNNVAVIPHGVDRLKSVSPSQARLELGIAADQFAILSFGFITWYKGSDFLVKTFANSKPLKNKDIMLILAGGPSFNQKNKAHYQNYYNRVTALAENQKHIRHTGFVAEADLAKYFAAADLVVLPYRTFMSASGPLSLALSFNKPFLLSNRLVSITKTADFQQAMRESKIIPTEILFPLSQNKLLTKIAKLRDDPSQLKKLARLSAELADKRDFARLAKVQAQLLQPRLNVSGKYLLQT